MTLTSTVRNSPAKRKKKPPACDSCKARRVLCHPQTDGKPCPRCEEKGVICKTTPVQRGRPRKAPEESVSPPASDDQLSASASGSNEKRLCESIVTVRPRIQLSDAPELPPELVKHLVECFVHFPECRLPLFHGDRLTSALASVSWQMNLLAPQLRVLASCACALSASISFDSSIIGPGPAPTSFADSSVFYSGSDLRTYGARRAPMCRALYERAFTLACETRIHIDASDDNAASCFFLDVLERLNETTSRPWAVAYVSHSRILAGPRDEAGPRQRGVWTGFLMAEALAATTRRMPVLFTHTDQLLMSGSEPPPLPQLFQALQAMHQTSKKASNIVFTAVVPYMFHVTTLARDLYDKITGDYARRHPIAEAAIIQFHSSLSILQSILSLVLDQLELSPEGEHLFYEFPGNDPSLRRREENLRACAFGMTVGFTSLVLALHREIEHRTSTDLPTTQDRGSRTHGLLQRQVYEMTSLAVEDVARTLHLLPSLPHLAHTEWNGIHDWAQFCLAEAAPTGTITPARVKVFETLIAALKLFGYSWDIPRSSELIDGMAAYVAQHQVSSLSPSLALSQMFPFDSGWTGMFGIDPRELTPYESGPSLVQGFL
ncbi:hypothetical protein B0H13DRAFT_1948743 [Mycena leptocephala]|nr:hypothetical protein B0H13DRAFT_1948743 [Mycena leptocephala]